LTAGPFGDLVFSRECRSPLSAVQPEGVTFHLLSGAVAGLRRSPALRRRYGRRGFAKAILKLATPARLLYCVVDEDGEILHDGWLRVGRWSRRPVGPRDVVVGPLSTRQRARRRGLATYGVISAMEAMRRRGHTTFFIGTAQDNVASQRLIAKCGFSVSAGPEPR